MKLISFDIGIKNMAYCIFDVSGQQLSIGGWNVLNLLEEEVSSEICSQIIPGKTKKILPKPCTKIAKYRKNGQCFCDKHAKSSQHIIPNKKNSLQYFKKLKIDDLIKIGQSHLLFLGSENLPKLKKDILDKINDFYEKNCFEPIIKKKSKTASETDLITIGKSMKVLLNNTKGIDEITHVVIENQISPIANRMKTIQGMLAQYFIMKNSDSHIEFVSSSHKLSQFKRGTNGSSQTSHSENKNSFNKKNVGNHDCTLENTITSNIKDSINPEYKQHKKDGIYYCSQILEQNICFNSYKEYLLTDKRRGSQVEQLVPLKKADDLADSFLQGIWYLKNQNIITYADDLKINIV
jgi:hypothetical protein